MNLFEYAETRPYPMSAGFKGSSDTSRAAAASIPAALLRGKVYDEFKRRGAMTADECAEAMRISILSVRPRCSELHRVGDLMDTGLRRKNASGRSAIVWKIP